MEIVLDVVAPEVPVLEEAVPSGPVVVDVGAMVGLTAVAGTVVVEAEVAHAVSIKAVNRVRRRILSNHMPRFAQS
ncbi:MAG: hypothetical protein WBZ45_08240 [Acidimicrobiia bacterium]